MVAQNLKSHNIMILKMLSRWRPWTDLLRAEDHQISNFLQKISHGYIPYITYIPYILYISVILYILYIGAVTVQVQRDARSAMILDPIRYESELRAQSAQNCFAAEPGS